MKKRILKNWVQTLLNIIICISLIVLVTVEANNLVLFILIKFTSLMIFILCDSIIMKYGNIL